MCKGNYASYVKTNPPQGWSRDQERTEGDCANIGTSGPHFTSFLIFTILLDISYEA